MYANDLLLYTHTTNFVQREKERERERAGERASDIDREKIENIFYSNKRFTPLLHYNMSSLNSAVYSPL